MPVELVSTDFVRRLRTAVAEARTRASTSIGGKLPPSGPGEGEYWEGLLEVNARELLAVLAHTRPQEGKAVRYIFYDHAAGELRVRPIVVAAGADLDVARKYLDWHPPPDAQRSGGAQSRHRDMDLLYAHFSVTWTAEGVFEYWFAMQELWASTHWAHARVLAGASELSELVSRPDWQTEREVEECRPAVVIEPDQPVHLAVLVHAPIRQETVTLEQIEIGRDQTIRYGESITVAIGPKGYLT